MQLLSVYTFHLASPFPKMKILTSDCRRKKRKKKKPETVAFPLNIFGQCPKPTNRLFHLYLHPKPSFLLIQEAYVERLLQERLWGGGSPSLLRSFLI